MEWINIKDKLPKPNVNVLGYKQDVEDEVDEKDGIIRVYYLYNKEKQKYYGYKNPVFREYCSDDCRWETDKITHWMPLPEKPE